MVPKAGQNRSFRHNLSGEGGKHHVERENAGRDWQGGGRRSLSKVNRNRQHRSKPRHQHGRGSARPPALEGLPTGLRIKGGICSNPKGDGFIVIVHVWDNVECRGEPQEWCSSEVFATEEEALEHYKVTIRPELQRMAAEMTGRQQEGRFIHRELE